MNTSLRAKTIARTAEGAVSTPSTPSGGTRANDAFNALIRNAEEAQAAVVDPNPVIPSEVIFDALQRDLAHSLPDTAFRATIAVLAVEALRDAGFDL